MFLSVLGMTCTHATELRDCLLQKVKSEECVIGALDEYGTRYVVDFTYVRSDREAMIRSAWIIKAGESMPRLTSCFVL